MELITEHPSPADWRADDLTTDDSWRFSLQEQDSTLSAIAAELTHGRGVALLQGLPLDNLTDELAVTICGRLGRVVPQPGGRLTVHVRDQGADPRAPTTRSYQHNAELGFHSDPTEAVALLCVRPALSGGLSTVISAVAVHNAMVRDHPDLAEVLYQPWWRDLRRGDDPDGYAASPVYAVDEEGRLRGDYGADYIRSAQRSQHVPRLTDAQRAAMAAMDRLTTDPSLALTMELKPGDMQFLNNRVIWHSRTAYRDHDDPALRRDLIRIWLDDVGRPKSYRVVQ